MDEQAEQTWVVDLKGFGRVVTGVRIRAANKAEAEQKGIARYGISVEAKPEVDIDAQIARANAEAAAAV